MASSGSDLPCRGGLVGQPCSPQQLRCRVLEVSGEPGPVGTCPFNADFRDRAETREPLEQRLVAGCRGRERLDSEQAADGVERSRHVNVEVGVHAACHGAALYDGHRHPFLCVRDGTHLLDSRTLGAGPLRKDRRIRPPRPVVPVSPGNPADDEEDERQDTAEVTPGTQGFDRSCPSKVAVGCSDQELLFIILDSTRLKSGAARIANGETEVRPTTDVRPYGRSHWREYARGRLGGNRRGSPFS